MRRFGWMLLGIFLLPVAAWADSPIKSDEEVVFFPTVAYRAADAWVVPIHGWIFEPEEDSNWREKLTKSLGDILELEKSEAERELFEKRLRWFLVDNERGKQIPVSLGGQVYRTGASEPNGHFETGFTIPVAKLPAKAGEFVPFRAVTRDGDERRFEGRVQLVGPEGTIVVSDIDDTIKVTEVLDRKAMIRNTFYLPFRAVPGMATEFCKWADQGAVLFYLSASPWQLWPDLGAFLKEAGFPLGAVSLRYARIKDSSLFDFISSSAQYKTETIRSLLKRFPKRRFILVGDSGEKDPMIYGGIFRQFPERIRHVFIRKVPGSVLTAERWEKDFAGVPAERWTAFDDPAELAGLKIAP